MAQHMLTLGNSILRAAFDRQTGALVQLEDRQRAFAHLMAPGAPTPFRVEQNGRFHARFRSFTYKQQGPILHLEWQLAGAVLRGEATLLDDGLAFRFHLQGPKAARYRAVEYPILDGLASQGDNSLLAHPYATGVLMRNPAAFLPSRGGLRFCPYPEGFSGACLQMMAYYHPGYSGLYMASEDGQGHQKWLNAYTRRGRLQLSHIYGFEDVGAAGGIEQPYAVVLRLFDGGGWEQAAERYRAFAHRQPWCAKGPLWPRRKQDDWLHEQVGYSTFGINAGHDRSRWLARFYQDIGTPGFHILGPDWTNRPQTFGRGVPGGYADWLPTRFNAATLTAIRRNGDRFAPFEFDFLVGLDQSDQQLLRDNLQVFPRPSLSHDAYRFHMLCPCQPYTQSFHRDRDVQVQKESGCDALYYDISANNLIKICLRGDHAHRPGGGVQLTQGYGACYRLSKEALAQSAHRPIPIGTEMMCETYLGEVDFYQARAWAQPASALETWPLRRQMRSGQAQMIPLFDYVYHEYGAVRLDGWGKLVEETGELFYYTVAKCYLWGGLYELNYEYSPLEALDGQENDPGEHYFSFDPQHFDYAPQKAAYLAQFAAARTRRAKPYWVYGRLLQAPPFLLPRKGYRWYHYNHHQHCPSYRAHGIYRARAIMTSLFESPDKSLALFIANCDGRPHRFTLDAAALPTLASPAQASLYCLKTAQAAQLVTDLRMAANQPQSILLAARSLYMLEIKKEERGTQQ